MSLRSSLKQSRWMKSISEASGRIKRKIIRDAGTKQGRGTKRKLVFGILCRNGTVWGEVVNDVEAGNTSTTHHSAGHARFRRLFRYLESLYGNRIPGICSPSGESWRETVQRRKRKSYQWPWGILGISENENLRPKEEADRTNYLLPRWICLAIQSPKGEWYHESETNSQTVRTGGWWLDCHYTLSFVIDSELIRATIKERFV